MENVPGLMSSQANGEGIFARILSDLSLPQGGGNRKRIQAVSSQADARKVSIVILSFMLKNMVYRNEAPLIVVGIRSDLYLEPEQINTQQSISTVRDAIQDLPRIRSGLSKEQDSYAAWARVVKTFAEVINLSESLADDL